MKLLALTSVLTVAASSAFAGAVAYVAPIMPEMIVEEPGSMGGSGLWLIPLILIALIFLVGQKECDIQSDPYCGTDY
ncbi:MAG: hypothetical protein KAS85_03960 [Rhodobacteraceae bacterium]|nr:hypothetical protein [Paracoccaceae bacterium]